MERVWSSRPAEKEEAAMGYGAISCASSPAPISSHERLWVCTATAHWIAWVYIRIKIERGLYRSSKEIPRSATTTDCASDAWQVH
ncbi:hypothetical protein E2C01_023135 [Portunus trituberculatus]|uniref:Uncharacterized protein n=1 Tax=Portunus trituberculatus TaxID=210409 RepID=A0A5B7EAC8_PORTR|nr:hypothetical protein [Portunus trituberculatus]